MKFFSLLKKEIKELMTMQTIIGILVSLFAFYILGSFMGGVTEDMKEKESTIVICDQDNSDFTKAVISTLEEDKNTTVKKVTLESDDYQKELKRLELDSLIIIPKGFSDTVFVSNQQAELLCVSKMSTMAMSGNMSGRGSVAGIETIKTAVSSTLMSYNKLGDSDITLIQNPIKQKDITIVGEKSAEVSTSALGGFLSMQGVFVPIVIFILVIYASQMIISAIATEKVDKTLETLLSAPVSRLSVLSAKMIAAALVAALNAVVYMFGFSKFMEGVTGDVDTEAGIGDAVTQLGLSLSGFDYVMLGMQMFLTILIALSISLILGALAKDVKSAQTLILPIMFSAMIPYMLTMFVDINSLPTVPKMLIFAIPFTHTFIAIDNIIFVKDTLFWGGFAYQVVFLIVCMYFAVRVFMTDKLFTISLSLGEKKFKSKSLLFKKK